MSRRRACGKSPSQPQAGAAPCTTTRTTTWSLPSREASSLTCRDPLTFYPSPLLSPVSLHSDGAGRRCKGSLTSGGVVALAHTESVLGKPDLLPIYFRQAITSIRTGPSRDDRCRVLSAHRTGICGYRAMLEERPRPSVYLDPWSRRRQSHERELQVVAILFVMIQLPSAHLPCSGPGWGTLHTTQCCSSCPWPVHIFQLRACTHPFMTRAVHAP